MQTIKPKVGDYVYIIDNHNLAADLGATATIYSVGSGEIPNIELGILWNRSDSRHNGQMDGGYNMCYFKIIKRETKEWDNEEN